MDADEDAEPPSTNLPPPKMLPPPTAVAPDARPGNNLRRGRRTGWIIAGAMAIGIVVLGLFAFGSEQLLTHDLLGAEFTEDDKTFFVGEVSGYRSEVRDGKYRLTATSPSPTTPLETFGFFARTAYNVDIQADIVALDTDDGAVGLECVNVAGGGAAGARYLFLAGTTGDGYSIALVTNSIANAEVHANEGGPQLRAGQRIGLRCSDRSVTGLVDGKAVIAIRNPAFDSFEAAALVFATQTEGDWVEFDHVTAVVPEH